MIDVPTVAIEATGKGAVIVAVGIAVFFIHMAGLTEVGTQLPLGGGIGVATARPADDRASIAREARMRSIASCGIASLRHHQATASARAAGACRKVPAALRKGRKARRIAAASWSWMPFS